MAVKEDKVRVMITFQKEFKQVLERAADAENRSLSNYLETMIKNNFTQSVAK